MISVLFVLIILAFKAVNNRSVIDAIYMIASYTYGPLLGLFVFGLFTKRNPRDKYVPYICIASPLICLATDFLVKQYAGYTFGYEMLMVNGGITFAGLWLSAIENGKLKIVEPPCGRNSIIAQCAIPSFSILHPPFSITANR